MKTRTKQLTTVALEQEQYLMIDRTKMPTAVEFYCKGFTNKKREKALDGYYYKSELHVKQ